LLTKKDQSLDSSSVLIANGKKPKNKKIIEILKNAKNVICVDNGYELASELNITPSVVIGDLDSVDINKISKDILIIKDEDQNTNDLEKTLNYCLSKNIRDIILVGATGERDDQNLATILVSLEYIEQLNIEILSDLYSIEFVNGERDFEVTPMREVSLISMDKENIITTQGLKYNLDKSKLSSATHGISNYSIGENFSISCSSPLIVFKKL
jgi:thiamine pyrophosphokinase